MPLSLYLPASLCSLSLSKPHRQRRLGLRNLDLLLGLENRVKYTIFEVLNGDYLLSRSGSAALLRCRNRCNKGAVWCCDVSRAIGEAMAQLKLITPLFVSCVLLPLAHAISYCALRNMDRTKR